MAGALGGLAALPVVGATRTATTGRRSWGGVGSSNEGGRWWWGGIGLSGDIVDVDLLEEEERAGLLKGGKGSFEVILSKKTTLEFLKFEI